MATEARTKFLTHPPQAGGVLPTPSASLLGRSAFSGQRYLDERGCVVAVAPGLGDCWIVGRLTATGAHRLKSPAVPVRKTAAECQDDLDAYAVKRGWLKVESLAAKTRLLGPDFNLRRPWPAEGGVE